MTDTTYVTLEQAAEMLSVKKRQIVSLIKQGKLRAKDVNASGGQRNTWRVLREDLLPSGNNNSDVVEGVSK